jgi:hypothetical protein
MRLKDITRIYGNKSYDVIIIWYHLSTLIYDILTFYTDTMTELQETSFNA